MDVSQSVALVTGGAQGIGKAIVFGLLKEGAKVVFADINEIEGKKMEDQCRKEFGDEHAMFKKCDVRDLQRLHEVFEETKSHFGSLDIVCNNAGIGDPDPSKASLMIQVNLTAVTEGTFKAIEMMSINSGGKGGVVVNMASVAGLIVGRMFPVYCATKAGVVSLTRCLAECKKEGVRVNCVCPSFADTNMLNVARENYPEFTKAFVSKFGLAELSDIAEAVLRCIKDETLAGNVLTVLPKGKVKVVEFPQVFSYVTSE